MSIFRHFFRILMGLFTAGVNRAENPAQSAEQILIEYDGKIRSSRSAVATLDGHVRQVRMNLEQKEKRASEISGLIDAALKQNRDDLAASYDTELQGVEMEIAAIKSQLASVEPKLIQQKEILDQMIKDRDAAKLKVNTIAMQTTIAGATENAATVLGGSGTNDLKAELDRLSEKADLRTAIAEAEMDLSSTKEDKDKAEFERQLKTGSTNERLAARRAALNPQ